MTFGRRLPATFIKPQSSETASNWRSPALKRPGSMGAPPASVRVTVTSAVGWLLADWPYALRLLATIVIEVFFMTYWLMPRLTRWLAPWIYPANAA